MSYVEFLEFDLKLFVDYVATCTLNQVRTIHT